MSSIPQRYLTAAFGFHRPASRSAADIRQRLARRSVPEPAVSNRRPLFDHLVGAGKQQGRNGDAQRLCHANWFRAQYVLCRCVFASIGGALYVMVIKRCPGGRRRYLEGST
jgi:hypothetical protein